MPDFLPRGEGDRIAWTGRFALGLAASPSKYGFTVERVERYLTQQRDAAEAWRRAWSPSTRTPVAVRVKNEQLAALLGKTRQLVAQVRGRPGLSDADLVGLGLRPRSRSRRRLRVPDRLPALRVTPTLRGVLEFWVIDPARPGSRAKPRGVHSLYLYRWVEAGARLALTEASQALPGVESAGPPGERAAAVSGGQPSLYRGAGRWQMVKGSTVMRFEMPVPSDVPAGSAVRYMVRWVSPTGEQGPGSTPTEIKLPPRYSPRDEHAERAAA